MVDRDLLDRVLRLDDDARRELRDVIDASLPVEVSPQLAEVLDSHIAEADAHPEDSVPWVIIQDRTHTRIAAAKKTA